MFQKYSDINELEKQYSKLKSEGGNAVGALKKVFLRHVQLGNLTEAEDIIKSFKNQNVHSSVH